MLLLWLCQFTGWCMAHTPVPLLAAMARGLGWLVTTLPLPRARLVRSNLHHAFPNKDPAWISATARLSAARLMEMGMYALASSYLSETKIRSMIHLPPEVAERFEILEANSQGSLFLIPHSCMAELLTTLPLLIGTSKGGDGTLFRPLKQPRLDAFVQRSRERFGLRMLSRRKGYGEATKILRAGGRISILFDQDAGRHGKYSMFFDRLVSTTNLPGLLTKRTGARAHMLFTKRIGFWRTEIQLASCQHSDHPEKLLLESDRNLQNHLEESRENCAAWLWFHDRWGTHTKARRRFRLREKDNILKDWIVFHNRDLPRNTRVCVRLPNWLGDVVMAIPLLRALEKGRPDAELILLGQAGHLPLLERWGVGHRYIPLPPKKPMTGHMTAFHRLRHEHFDTYVTLTNSFRGDLAGRLMRIPQRMGMLRPGKRRPLLTDHWELPADLDETNIHQLQVWHQYLRAFGLNEPLDTRPLKTGATRKTATKKNAVGLICGTENTPEKRWPVEKWREFIKVWLEADPDSRCILFGTPNDVPIAEQVAKNSDTSRVIDLVGRTGIVEFVDALEKCRVVVCNDTGGMHLANAIGVPVVAVFGPTNPVRTGPVYDAPVQILLPPGCPKTGGADISGVEVETVIKACSAPN